MTLSLYHWCPGSGVVLDCIDSRSLPPLLLEYFKAFISDATRHFTDIQFEDSSPTDLKTDHRNTALRALCAKTAKSIYLSACLLVCLFVCNKTTLVFA